MRRHIPSDMEQRSFDLIVIGAGINGVSIARDAAIRGLDVLVLDKSDIGSGTTSWSTRLIHGGLRYLEHAELGLVRESLRERELLLDNAGHLVKPLPLLLPMYEGARRGPKLIRAGMVLYDLLSFDKSLPRHRMMSTAQVTERAPGLRSAGLRGGALYYDGQASNSERLAVENALSAHDHGATILTYARVDQLLTDGAVVRGVAFTDLATNTRIEARGKLVVNVTGPWIDAVLSSAPKGSVKDRYIGGTKGSHLVVAPFAGAPDVAIYYEANADGRAVFIVPWNGFLLIGSTDIRYDGDLDNVRTSDDEIEYLLKETNNLLPEAGLTPDDVLYTYCGVRPLPYKPSGKEGSITRNHVVINHAPGLRGLYSIVGGKLTTHRSLAEEVVDEACKTLDRVAKCKTARMPLPGAAGIDIPTFKRQLTRDQPVKQSTISRLVDIYGVRAREVLAIAHLEPALAEQFDQETGAIAAEVVFAARHEAAHSLEDILLRRTMVGLASHAGVGPDRAAATIAASELGWDAARTNNEVAAYRAYVKRFRPRSLRRTIG